MAELFDDVLYLRYLNNAAAARAGGPAKDIRSGPWTIFPRRPQ